MVKIRGRSKMKKKRRKENEDARKAEQMKM